jgi:hypothetical protein
MAAYNPTNVNVGVGTLYAAPIGTAEPVAVTGAWQTGWQALGYTDQGSVFTYTPAFEEVVVEEEYWPLRQSANGAKAEMTFALAESTAANLALALNAGIGTGVLTSATGNNPDGSVWVEPPVIGQEVRIMIGWDSLVEGAAQPSPGAVPFGRLIMRQCLQTGALSETHRRGSNKRMYACTFSVEKPPNAQPFRFIYPPSLSGGVAMVSAGNGNGNGARTTTPAAA